MTKEELIVARAYLNDIVENKNCNEYKTIKTLIDNALRKCIILDKCDERESRGYDTLNDSDVMDILEECERLDVEISREYINKLFDEK